MAILDCYECGGQVSDRAEFCPHCGAPVESSEDQFIDKQSDMSKDSPPPVFSQNCSDGTLVISRSLFEPFLLFFVIQMIVLSGIYGLLQGSFALFLVVSLGGLIIAAFPHARPVLAILIAWLMADLSFRLSLYHLELSPGMIYTIFGIVFFLLLVNNLLSCFCHLTVARESDLIAWTGGLLAFFLVLVGLLIMFFPDYHPGSLLDRHLDSLQESEIVD